MVASPYRQFILTFAALMITAGFAQAQVVIQQAPQILVVKPNPIAAIADALLASGAQNPNAAAAQSNNAAAVQPGATPYPSSNGACQPGYVFDGHGYCIVPYPAQNNAASPTADPASSAAVACLNGYVLDGQGSCVLPNVPQQQQQHAPPTAPASATEDTSDSCPRGYALGRDGNCSFSSATNPYQK